MDMQSRAIVFSHIILRNAKPILYPHRARKICIRTGLFPIIIANLYIFCKITRIHCLYKIANLPMSIFKKRDCFITKKNLNLLLRLRNQPESAHIIYAPLLPSIASTSSFQARTGDLVGSQAATIRRSPAAEPLKHFPKRLTSPSPLSSYIYIFFGPR